MSVPILGILFTRGGGRILAISFKKPKGMPQKGVGYGHKGGWCPECKVTVLPLDWVVSWRWPCGFVHHC